MITTELATDFVSFLTDRGYLNVDGEATGKMEAQAIEILKQEKLDPVYNLTDLFSQFSSWLVVEFFLKRLEG